MSTNKHKVSKHQHTYKGGDQQEDASHKDPSGGQSVGVVLHTRSVWEEVTVDKHIFNAWILHAIKVSNPLLAREVCAVDIFVFDGSSASVAAPRL